MTELLKNTTVMVVDDNADTCEMLRIALEDAGASVVVAQSVGAAVDAFRRRPPHVLLADIRLGDTDGYALIKTIREHNTEYRGFTPAIALTGFASPEDESRAMAAGFNAYISKPFDPADVISAITKILPYPGNRVA
jgi:CheY-like chemotaxis protein